MSDAIRNAIIRLSIELKNPNFKMPDLGPAIEQQKALAAAIKQQEAAVDAVAKTSQSASTPTKQLGIAFEELDRYAAMAAQSNSTLAKETRALAEAVAFESSSVAISTAANRESVQGSEVLAAANLKLSSSYTKAGGAAIGVAKGAAFVAAGSSDALS